MRRRRHSEDEPKPKPKDDLFVTCLEPFIVSPELRRYEVKIIFDARAIIRGVQISNVKFENLGSTIIEKETTNGEKRD